MDGSTATGRRPRVVSMFSGMEAASVAAHPLGWEFVSFAEIEPAACHTLHHHYGCGRPLHLPRADGAATPKEAKDRAARARALAALPEAAPGAPVNVGDVTQVDWSSYRGQVDVVVGGPPCFPAGSLILSKRGLVPIEDIRVGDEVLTHKQRWRRVVETMAKEGSTVILKGQGHWGLETTSEHPFWARRPGKRRWLNEQQTSQRSFSEPEWIEARDMRGMFWSAPMQIPFEGAMGILREASGNGIDAATPEFMWVVGAWLGDGWTRHRMVDGRRKHEVIICANKADADCLAEKIAAAGMAARPSDERTTTKFSSGNSKLVGWLHAHFGKGAAGKTVPAWVLSLPREFRVALLDGYRFADGTTQKGARSTLEFTRFTTVARGLAVGIRMLVNSLGYGCTVMHHVPKRQKCVIEGREVRELPQYHVAYHGRSRGAFSEDGMMWGCVRSVRETGETKQVFNFEVEEDNSYVVDGIVVHNCQAFSFAGLRRSLDDDRGNLSLAYVRAIHAIEPIWSFTENVPGWLSTKDNAFGCFLGALVGADAPLEPPSGGRWGSAGAVDGPLYRAAWRILDAQGFVPQRRRRVFVVACRVGSGRNPCEVLWETEAEVERHLGERRRAGPLFPVAEVDAGNSAPRGEAQQDPADAAPGGSPSGGLEGLIPHLLIESGEASLMHGVPQAYRVHAAFSTAMTSNGDARVADPVQSARSLDTCGGFATNQGGNIVVQPVVVERWIPGTATTLRARDAKGTPDSDCTQTLLPMALVVDVQALAIHARQYPDSGAVTRALDTEGYSVGILVGFGGSAGMKLPMLSLDQIPREPIAFNSKDHGADAGEISPTLRAAGHDTSHQNGGAPAAVCYVCDGPDAPPGTWLLVGEPGMAPPGSPPCEVIPPLDRTNPREGRGPILARLVYLCVRRLMPSECLALQGFPTDYLDGVRVRGKPMPDGPRYKLCGNSWAAPLISWVFERMDRQLRD